MRVRRRSRREPEVRQLAPRSSARSADERVSKPTAEAQLLPVGLTAGLGAMLDDGHLFDLINKILFVDVFHRPVPQWICPVVKILRKSLYLRWCVVPEIVVLASLLGVTHTGYLELGWDNIL